jgi:hypothetical protein
MTFDLPKYCFITIEVSTIQAMEGPVQVTIHVPGNEVAGSSPAEKADSIRKKLNAAIDNVAATSDRADRDSQASLETGRLAAAL